MPSPREAVLKALLGALQTMPAATVFREEVLPERLPAGDGKPLQSQRLAN